MKNGDFILLILLRLIAACIFAVGAVWLASEGKDGWGWCIFASILLGGVSLTTKNNDNTTKETN